MTGSQRAEVANNHSNPLRAAMARHLHEVMSFFMSDVRGLHAMRSSDIALVEVYGCLLCTGVRPRSLSLTLVLVVKAKQEQERWKGRQVAGFV